MLNDTSSTNYGDITYIFHTTTFGYITEFHEKKFQDFNPLMLGGNKRSYVLKQT